MTVNKYSVSIPPKLSSSIEERMEPHEERGQIGRSTVISRSLDRYFFLLDTARREVAEYVTDAEMSLILDVLNGSLFTEPFSTVLLPAEISDSLVDGYADKWVVDGKSLVKKLKAMTPVHYIAIIDAAERWWNRVAAGENGLAPSEALKVGKK